MTASSTSQRLLVVVLVVLLAAIGVVLLTGSRSRTAPSAASAFQGPTFPSGVRAAGFSLTDEHGHRVSLSQYRGRVVVLTFIHSQCKDACPLMVEDIKGALNSLPGTGRGVAAIGITAEPAQDTVQNRRKFLAEHHMAGRLVYLNGPATDLRRIWRAYHVDPVLPRQPQHTAFVIVIDKAGVERLGYPAGQLTPESLTHDIQVLERERA
jgi:cytochrome oxidase Cu insertion factor (SCO1/SenC/PrrC family)